MIRTPYEHKDGRYRPTLRQRQDAFLERYLCSDLAVPEDLESARFWRSGAN